MYRFFISIALTLVREWAGHETLLINLGNVADRFLVPPLVSVGHVWETRLYAKPKLVSNTVSLCICTSTSAMYLLLIKHMLSKSYIYSLVTR